MICVTFDQKCGNAEKMASGGGGGGGKAVGKEEYHGGLSTHIVLSNHKESASHSTKNVATLKKMPSGKSAFHFAFLKARNSSYSSRAGSSFAPINNVTDRSHVLCTKS